MVLFVEHREMLMHFCVLNDLRTILQVESMTLEYMYAI